MTSCPAPWELAPPVRQKQEYLPAATARDQKINCILCKGCAQVCGVQLKKAGTVLRSYFTSDSMNKTLLVHFDLPPPQTYIFLYNI